MLATEVAVNRVGGLSCHIDGTGPDRHRGVHSDKPVRAGFERNHDEHKADQGQQARNDDGGDLCGERAEELKRATKPGLLG